MQKYAIAVNIREIMNIIHWNVRFQKKKQIFFQKRLTKVNIDANISIVKRNGAKSELKNLNERYRI